MRLCPELDCSGVDPCPQCAQLLVNRVLVPSLAALQLVHPIGPQQAQAYLMTYTQSYRQLRAELVEMVEAQQAAAVLHDGSGTLGLFEDEDKPLTETELHELVGNDEVFKAEPEAKPEKSRRVKSTSHSKKPNGSASSPEEKKEEIT